MIFAYYSKLSLQDHDRMKAVDMQNVNSRGDDFEEQRSKLALFLALILLFSGLVGSIVLLSLYSANHTGERSSIWVAMAPFLQSFLTVFRSVM